MEKMNLYNRAKIFLPFDALKGFREALKKQEKIKVDKKVLSTYQKEEIMKTIKSAKLGSIINLEYYSTIDNDYLSLEGVLTKIDDFNKSITIVKKEILMEDIYKIRLSNKREVQVIE